MPDLFAFNAAEDRREVPRHGQIRYRCPGSGSLPANVSITSPVVSEEAVPVPLNKRSSTPDLLSYLRSRPKILKRVPRASRERLSLPSDRVILKLDFKTIRLDKMLHAATEHLPELFPYIYSCYSSPFSLLLRHSCLQSAEGVQQAILWGLYSSASQSTLSLSS